MFYLLRSSLIYVIYYLPKLPTYLFVHLLTYLHTYDIIVIVYLTVT